ncbi:MAG: hypothetical protein Q8Q03_01490, partial [bacterium]|nr:hypothetical protein [bacterium]
MPKIILLLFLLMGFQVPHALATEIPPCPFNPQTGRTIVNFTIGGHIATLEEAAIVSDTQNYPTFTYRKNSLPATLSAGVYNITLFGVDLGIDRASLVTEPNERWFVILSNGSNEVVRTNPTDDLQDGVNTATQEKVVNTSLDLLLDIDSFVAYHAQYPDTSSPNSLFPICAAFDLIPPPPPPPPAIPPVQDNSVDGDVNIATPPVQDHAVEGASVIDMPPTQDNVYANAISNPTPPVQDNVVSGGVGGGGGPPPPPPPIIDNSISGGSGYVVPPVLAAPPPVIVYTPIFPDAGIHRRGGEKEKNTLWNLPYLINKE